MHELPPLRRRPPNALARRARPEPVAIDRRPVRSTIAEIGRLDFVQVRRTDSESLFKALMEEHHYLGYTQVAGAPLDNNVCERILKKAILHRKNALFFKTQNGANVADLFMSLIHTAELARVDPFDYLNQLQRHAAPLAAHPQQWMPWNYRQTLAALNLGPDPPS